MRDMSYGEVEPLLEELDQGLEPALVSEFDVIRVAIHGSGEDEHEAKEPKCVGRGEAGLGDDAVNPGGE